MPLQVKWILCDRGVPLIRRLLIVVVCLCGLWLVLRLLLPRKSRISGDPVSDLLQPAVAEEPEMTGPSPAAETEVESTEDRLDAEPSPVVAADALESEPAGEPEATDPATLEVEMEPPADRLDAEFSSVVPTDATEPWTAVEPEVAEPAPAIEAEMASPGAWAEAEFPFSVDEPAADGREEADTESAELPEETPAGEFENGFAEEESAEDMIEVLARELHEQLTRMSRQPLFEMAKEHGIPAARLVVMSREELIEAVEQAELAHAASGARAHPP